MARPPKPTQLLELNGAFDKNPSRKKKRENEPAPNGPVGAPPPDFTLKQVAIWNEVVGLVAPGVLALSDRLIVEMIVRLQEKLRNGKIHGGELSILASAYTRLGLTPADRSRVSVPKKLDENGDEDPLASFAPHGRGLKRVK